METAVRSPALREHDENFLRIKTKGRVKRKRVDIEAILKKADTPRASRPVKDRFHQLPPNPVALHCWIYDDGAHRPDRVTLAEKIETQQPGHRWLRPPPRKPRGAG